MFMFGFDPCIEMASGNSVASLFLVQQVPEVELVLEHASDGAASPATALSGGATQAWPGVQALDRPTVEHEQPRREYPQELTWIKMKPGKVRSEIS